MHFPPKKHVLALPVAVCALLCACAATPGIVWERGADLPEPAGLKGMYAGVSNGRVILAGGSNFPVPRSQGGKKTFARRIFTRAVDASAGVAWSVDATALDEGMSEGASVTTPEGVVVIGGSTERGASAKVSMLGWDAAAGKVTRRELPGLPEPAANAAAVFLRGKIYAAGGENAGRASGQLRELDLAAALAGRGAWRELPSWPGEGRFGAVMAALKTRDGERLFLFGGRRESKGAVVQADYLAEGMAYDFSTRSWSAVAPMPHRALAATGARIDERQLVIMGGSDGHDIEKMAALGERYRLPDHVMLYDAKRDRWSDAGRMPVGVAEASAVRCGNRWLVAGGEPSPALRINHTYLAAFPDY